jgi:multiple sugar transport system substrate-binding protein
MKRVFGFTAALLAAMLISAASQAVEITFYHYQANENYEAFRKILDDFEAANPDVTVTDIYSQSLQITADVQAALAARRPVDIATVIGKNVRHFIKNTPAVAINAEPAKTTFLGNYLPNFLDIGRNGDKVFAVPHSYGTPMMYYNKDLFRSAGLNPETPPTNWNDAIVAAKAIEEKTSASGLAHMVASAKDYGTMLMVMNAGSNYLSPDGTCAVFDSQEGIAGIGLWQDLVTKYKVTTVANDRQYEAAFSAGRLGIFMHSSAALQPFVRAANGKFELGVANYPEFKAGQQRRLPNSGAALILYSPEGERRDAALKLLAYLSMPEVSNRWARESGYMPLATDPLSDPEMAAYVREFPFVQPVIDQMAVTVPTATWGETGALEAQTIVSNMIDQLWAGSGSAAQLVPDAVKRMNAVMGCTTN